MYSSFWLFATSLLMDGCDGDVLSSLSGPLDSELVEIHHCPVTVADP